MLAHRRAVPDDARHEHQALFDDHPPVQRGLERRQHLVERRGREEAEAAEVHAENRHAEIADGARHREQRAVTAEDDQEIGEARQLRLVGGRGTDGGNDSGGFFLERHVETALGQPVDETGDDLRRPRGVGLRNDPDPFHASAATD